MGQRGSTSVNAFAFPRPGPHNLSSSSSEDNQFSIGVDEDEPVSTAPEATKPPTQDEIIERLTDNATTIQNKPRSSLWILFILFIIFVVLVISTGIRCATDTPPSLTVTINGTIFNVTSNEDNHIVACSMYSIPSVGAMINSTSTGPLAITALNTLIAIHLLLSINTFILLKDDYLITSLLMLLTSFVLYIMFYVALISPKWYMALTPIILLGLWCSLATYGLFKYYRYHPTRKLLFTSMLCLLFYVVPAILYIAFSAVAYGQVPQKDIAVLVCELFMLISCCGFVIVLAFHTRRVSYATHVKKGYNWS